MYHRLICLVHMTGSGKHGDPRRPEYALAALTGAREHGGKRRPVHYHEVHDRHLALNDKRPEIRVFEIGKAKPEAIEAEMQKCRRDFKLADFRVAAR